MSDRNAFDRQLEREIEHLAGPDPYVDVSEVVGRATRPAQRSRLPSPFRFIRLAAAAAIVILFGGFLILGGVLGPTDDPDEPVVGASPSTSPDDWTSVIEAAPNEPVDVSYVTGDFVEASGYGIARLTSEVMIHGPLELDVSASDARLSGRAVEYFVTATYADRDKEPGSRVSQPGQGDISATFIWIEISNDDGTWTGTAGPSLSAEGLPPTAQAGGEGTVANDGSFERRGAFVLRGSGAYEGHTAYLDFGDTADEGLGPHGNAFEAVIVNRPPPGNPTNEQIESELASVGIGPNTWITADDG